MRNFIFKLKRSIDWFKFIWKLECYEDEYMFILEIQKYKVQRMINYCNKHWGDEQLVDEVEEMKHYISLIEQVQSDNFETNEEDWDKMCDYFKEKTKEWWI